VASEHDIAESLTIRIRAGHPDFLDLPWDQPLATWDSPNLVDLPKGLSRHEVRFVAYPESVYVVKELPTQAARRDYNVLRALETSDVLAATPVGLIEGRHPDPGSERSAALVTQFEESSFSFHELLTGPGFGDRRDQMLDAFAGLLVELHLAGCFWGDCSLSNVLYRYDAEAVDPIMIDGETAMIRETLSRGQREEDLEIMILNVAGGMANIAAGHGVPIAEADLALGEDIAARYRALWQELTEDMVVGTDERYRVTEKIRRLNELGFDVDEVDLLPGEGGGKLRVKVKVGGRNFYSTRLKRLTGIDALERQARQILSDLHYFQVQAGALSATAKSVAAVRWRLSVFEPLLERLRGIDGIGDALQAYCDLLHYRYLKSLERGADIGTDTAFESWLAEGCPAHSPSRPRGVRSAGT
jgi:hypothetical protein